MTTKRSDPQDDELWLETLAGRPGSPGDGAADPQAERLRTVLSVRKTSVDKKVPLADEALFLRIQAAVYRDELAARPANFAAPGDTRASLGSTLLRWVTQPRWVWGVAATGVLASALTLQLLPRLTRDADDLVLRGSNVTVQIVEDPGRRAAELVLLLQGAGVKPQVRTHRNGRVELTVDASPEALNALATERIDPQPKDGKVVIVLERPSGGEKR